MFRLLFYVIICLLIPQLLVASELARCELMLFKTFELKASNVSGEWAEIREGVYKIHTQDSNYAYVLRRAHPARANLSFEVFASELISQLSSKPNGALVVPSRILSPGELDLLLNVDFEIFSVDQFTIQPFLKQRDLMSYLIAHNANKLEEIPSRRIQEQLSELLLTRVLVGIPDNHRGNFLVDPNTEVVISIDHARLFSSVKSSSDRLSIEPVSFPLTTSRDSLRAEEDYKPYAEKVSNEFFQKIMALKLEDVVELQGESPFFLYDGSDGRYFKSFEERLEALKQLLKSTR